VRAFAKMTQIVREEYFDGSKEKLERLGLWALIDEIKSAITSFPLNLKKEIHANGAATLREMIDDALRDVGDWTNAASGDVDWIKCRVLDGVRVCVGVEIQMSARSDLIFRDIVHFQKQMREGQIDVCVEVLPSDAMSPYLTDRTPRFSDGVRVIKEMRADDLPIVFIAIEHNGFCDVALGKRLTNIGKNKT
jgi:hypothetical protein